MSDEGRKKLVSTSRKVLKSVTRAYSTVPMDALQALCGQMPLDLKLWEKVAAYCIRKGKDDFIPDLVVPRANSFSPGVKIDDETFADGTIGKAEARRTVRNPLVRAWQKRWEVSNTGRRVFNYFPDIERRLSNERFTPDPYTTQFMIGHGNLAKYLKRIKKKDSANCECGSSKTSNHTLNDCYKLNSKKIPFKMLVRTKGHP